MSRTDKDVPYLIRAREVAGVSPAVLDVSEFGGVTSAPRAVFHSAPAVTGRVKNDLLVSGFKESPYRWLPLRKPGGVWHNHEVARDTDREWLGRRAEGVGYGKYRRDDRVVLRDVTKWVNTVLTPVGFHLNEVGSVAALDDVDYATDPVSGVGRGEFVDYGYWWYWNAYQVEDLESGGQDVWYSCDADHEGSWIRDTDRFTVPVGDMVGDVTV